MAEESSVDSVTDWKGKIARRFDYPLIPVWIDAERTIDDLPMARATYFVISTDLPGEPPTPGFISYAAGQQVVVFDFQGVIAGVQGGPSPENLPGVVLFATAESVAGLFHLEEFGFTIQLEDIWIPSLWLRTKGRFGKEERALARGDVFRVGWIAFQRAYQYSEGAIGIDQLREIVFEEDVIWSPIETEAFRAWAQGEIDQAKQAFPEKEVKLRYRSTNDR